MKRVASIPLRSLAAASLALALSCPAPASAKDLGVRGATWAIAETDLLVQIEERLAVLRDTGALARFEQEAKARARSRIEAPARVAGIAPARERRTWLFDPAVVIKRDITGPDGTVLAAAGTRIDPFVRFPLTRDLLFIDGTREVEVAWALAHERPAKIVLLAGRPLDLARTHGRPFFFDQSGRLAERFGLRATPSLVTREGAQLRIVEIPLEERPRAVSGTERADGPEKPLEDEREDRR